MCLDETQGHTFSLQLALQRKRAVPTFHARWNGKETVLRFTPAGTKRRWLTISRTLERREDGSLFHARWNGKETAHCFTGEVEVRL